MREIAAALLDGIDNPDALAWAREWSDATEGAYADDALRARLREALDTNDQIPFVTRRGEYLYNFWRDAAHVRGLWRRTTLAEYLTDTPAWEVLIDLDALAADEAEDWVWKGAAVRPLVNDRALVHLSRGGADATVVREFDLATRSFVADGFTIDEAKTDAVWVDLDTLLVATDTGEKNALTASGYPAQVQRWVRADGGTFRREEVFRGEHEDVSVGVGYDPTPGFERTVFSRALDFYNSRIWVDGVEIDVPTDCEVRLHRQWLFIQPRTAFAGVGAGQLAVIDFAAFQDGARDFRVLVADATVEHLAFTRTAVLVTTLQDVVTHITRFALGTWEREELSLPDAASAHVVATSPLDGDEAWLAASSFTTPTTLLRYEPGGETTSGSATSVLPVKNAPVFFDASTLETRQHWVNSADGTRVPYFITGDFSRGAQPTLVGGYGGFEVSLLPSFSNARGIGWLEKGYFYVQPNLRGGGEFGPEWHSQVVKTNRHKVWEDHRAVLEDVIARGYAKPEQIGIRGGSNGGLLTSGALVQYPQLIGAAVIQVPLTDMLRYHTLSAGASWMAEYGDPDDPVERAAIARWSPLHNVRGRAEVAYPPALVTTSTRDDRVHPAHARTFAQTLDRAGQPVDYFENTAGGHAGAADNDQVARVESLIFIWLERHLTGS
ncbi:prolyl oligopeptidase family serine peptidase [Corynebacterium sp. TA-R-1]|uniref:Prolyl oligopeptidase family serine peptidase n=1 Tax=Corynebacterium stercoris TaxID=2943490 RepID=A0ABT1G681_9CORY|nr:prolyl oligopeptidase family serine peptidase [Corynebacterium stercoris]